ncbi:MAG: hypothetical protein ACI9MC_001405 [Kiritimatiellia bacterium]|jgi:hypothetical protein
MALDQHEAPWVALTVGADGSVHVAWQNDQATVRYLARSADGQWSEPQTLGHASVRWKNNPIELVATPPGEVHVWHFTGESYVDWKQLHHYKVVGDGVDNDCDGNAG